MKAAVLNGFAAVALVAFGLTGCGFMSGSHVCPSWAGFETPQAKYDEADLVIVTASTERDGTTPIFGVKANSYQIRVDEVLKGHLGSDTVRVSSMPDPCSGIARYEGGDPLNTSERLLIFAHQQNGEWFTLTPFDGTLPYSPETIKAISR